MSLCREPGLTPFDKVFIKISCEPLNIPSQVVLISCGVDHIWPDTWPRTSASLSYKCYQGHHVKFKHFTSSHSNKHHSKCTQIILKSSRMKPTGRLNLIPSLNSIFLQFRKECFITTTNIYALFPKRFTSMAITCHLLRYLFTFLMADIVPFVAGTFP